MEYPQAQSTFCRRLPAEVRIQIYEEYLALFWEKVSKRVYFSGLIENVGTGHGYGNSVFPSLFRCCKLIARETDSIVFAYAKVAFSINDLSTSTFPLESTTLVTLGKFQPSRVRNLTIDWEVLDYTRFSPGVEITSRPVNLDYTRRNLLAMFPPDSSSIKNVKIRVSWDISWFFAKRYAMVGHRPRFVLRLHSFVQFLRRLPKLDRLELHGKVPQGWVEVFEAGLSRVKVIDCGDPMPTGVLEIRRWLFLNKFPMSILC